jgi:YfiR/HmsC-like
VEVILSGLRRALLLALVGVGASSWVHAQRAEAPEASVKAAFLYKFAGYIDWPPAFLPAADEPFVIGVMGSEEVAAELARIVPGRSVEGHPVTMRRLRDGDSIRGVHLLFAGHLESARLQAVLRAAREQGTLTVTETGKGLELGSAINFVVTADRVGFEVSLEAAEKSGHRISSRMLAVARRVVPRAS